MKKALFGIALALLVLGPVCTVTQPLLSRPQAATPKMHASEARLRSHVAALVDTPSPRSHARPGVLDSVAAYIFNNLSQFSNRVSYQPFVTDNVEYRNVVASFGPAFGQRLVVGAHYDVCGNQPGADDNASGVAAVMELAQLLSESSARLPYRTDIVTFTLEEPPHFARETMGSAVHARLLREEGIEVRLMVSVEMVGYFVNEPNSQNQPTFLLEPFYPSVGNFLLVVGRLSDVRQTRTVKRLLGNASSLGVRSINAPASIPGIDFSDHRNYWASGFPAVMITDTAFYRNPNYHEKTDTIDTLNFPAMAQVVQGLFEVVTRYP